jgi:hypothetical protein
MRDNRTGLECCEACSFKLGGPAEFLKYVDSGKAIRRVQKPAAFPKAPQVFRLKDDKKEINNLMSFDPAKRQRYRHQLETDIAFPIDASWRVYAAHNLSFWTKRRKN